MKRPSPSASSRRRYSTIFSLIFYFIVLSTCVFSQDLAEIFRVHLPDKLLQDETSRKQIASRLSSKSAIHPELVYHFIRYYQDFADDSIRMNKEKRQQLDARLQLIETGYIKRKNEFIHREMDALDSIPSLFTEDVRDLFMEQLADSVSDKPSTQTVLSPSEQRFCDYVVCRLLDQSFTAPFDSLAEYASMRTVKESEERERTFRWRNEKNVSLFSTPKEVPEGIIGHWYLFTPQSGGGTQNNFTRPAEILIELMKNMYATVSQPRFSIGVGFTMNSYGFTPETSIPIGGSSSPQKVRSQFKRNIFSLTAGYKYYFKEYVENFSFVNVQLTVAHAGSGDPHSLDPTFDKIYSTNERKYGTEYHENLTFKKLTISPVSMSSYHLKVTTPFGVWAPVVFEIGLQTGVQFTKYVMEYQYSYYFKETYLVDGTFIQYYIFNTIAQSSDKKKVEATQTNVVFTPLVDITMNYSRELQFRLSSNVFFASLSILYSID